MKLELLAPAGNMEKLKTALHFGADAVYLAGKQYGLRAFADNFTDSQLAQAVQYAHSLGKKVYVTLNIFAKNSDFDNLTQYLHLLEEVQADAVLVSDVGMLDFVRSNCNIPIHISTQANTTNLHAVRFWQKCGAQRVVLARELPLCDIADIHKACPQMQLEAFVHGAMCISYSGRCLLSNYLVQRDGNRGECVQACRWQWQVREVSRQDFLDVQEDDKGTYIFNSKDLNLLPYLPNLAEAGVCSFKVEGRMKSAFYVASAVNAYRRALDAMQQGTFLQTLPHLCQMLQKASHRSYTTGFCVDDGQLRQYYPDSRPTETYKFVGVAKGWHNGVLDVEVRNRLQVGDNLEILSVGQSDDKAFCVENISCQGESLQIANKVKQIVQISCPFPMQEGDMLRKKI